MEPLQQHQPSCESLVSQSFQLLLDCLAASSKVDKPEELTVSLEAVKAAQEGYERCKRHSTATRATLRRKMSRRTMRACYPTHRR